MKFIFNLAHFEVVIFRLLFIKKKFWGGGNYKKFLH
jgi:hypothetical protein